MAVLGDSPRPLASARRLGLVAGGCVAVVAATAVLVGSASHERAEPALPSAPSAIATLPLRVEWGGCAEVRWRNDAPWCLVGAGAVLRLWIEDPRHERLEVAVDGSVVPVERFAIEGEPGGGLRVRVPAGAASLVVRVPDTPPGEGAWSLALGPVASELPLRLPAEIGRAIGERDAEAARRAAERTFADALAGGRLSQAVDLALVVTFELARRRLDAAAAARLLQRVDAAAQRYPKGRGDLAAYRGLHHWYRGATQDAAESLRDAARVAVRLEDTALAADAIPIYAETLAQLGYFEDARRWAREGLRIVRARHPCELGSALRTVGWVNLRLRQRGRPHDDPAPFLQEALQVFDAGGRCPRAAKRGGAHLSLALLALDQGRLDDAAARLAAIDRAALALDERVLADDIDVRIGLAQDDVARAGAAYERLVHSAGRSGTSDARWRLHTRRGCLLERRGDDVGAIAAFRLAEAELDELVRLQAVGIGRGELAERYHESTDALVERLLARGEPERAWCIVRQDQARRRTATAAPSVLSTTERAELDEEIRRYRQHRLEADELEARADELPRDERASVLHDAALAREASRALANALAKTLGTRAPHPRCAELAPPAPGELLLGLYPREREWLVLATDDVVGTIVAAVPAPAPDDPPEALARALLEPVGARLEAATRVRVLAHRQAQRIDVHALPWRGAPLGTRVPVSYGVELPITPASASTSSGRRALLVADPTDTLEGAEAEVARVHEQLASAGWTTSVVSRRDLPPPGTLSLAGHDLFHYAGHAEASSRSDRGGWPPFPGGEAGWAAFLELGPAGRLTAHDVITTRQTPRMAVLAGCRTGALELDHGHTSLALAFLVAGSEQVIASAEAVQDARGARFAQELYAALERGSELDLVQAMQRAQRALWDAGEEPAGYRVWVR